MLKIWRHQASLYDAFGAMVGQAQFLDPILAQAAELGASHGLGRGLDNLQLQTMLGISAKDPRRYTVIAAYNDGRDIAAAEADAQQEAWPQPIARAHKLWLRSNLINHAGLADMLQVSAGRIYQAVAAAYWWPYLESALASQGLRLPPGTAPPPCRAGPQLVG